MSDYYAILGLDPTASRESIKNAYRRLARETHPDMQISASDREKRAQSTQMAELNQAYAVLSDTKQRREYDEKLRIEEVLAAKSVSTRQPKTGNISQSGQRIYVRPRHEVDPTVVKEFSNHLRSSFLSDREHFSWKEKELEGLEWGLEALFWSSHYFVASRGCSALDAATMKKLTDYCEVAIAQCHRQLRKSYFLFLFPFQQLSNWELISGQCQRFAAGENGVKSSGATIGIVLLDMQHGRTLRFGNPVKEKRFSQLLQKIETPSS